jgi:ubiquinone/menaquinone biosynthesis C-methylase UbiE
MPAKDEGSGFGAYPGFGGEPQKGIPWSLHFRAQGAGSINERAGKMEATGSKWQSAETIGTFLEGIRRAVPGAELQMRVIGRIAELWCPSPARILDLGCGDGIMGRFLLDLFPDAHGVFLDFSDPMLDAARKLLNGHSRATVLKADFETSGWLEAVASSTPFDLVVSAFAIHHQTDERKERLYEEIYPLLKPGGAFLNLEHVSSPTGALGELFDQFYIDHLHDFYLASDPARNRDDVAETYHNRPDKDENILAPLDVQCGWLREIGFQDVDCFFKVFEIALFGGRKPAFSPSAD